MANKQENPLSWICCGCGNIIEDFENYTTKTDPYLREVYMYCEKCRESIGC